MTAEAVMSGVNVAAAEEMKKEPPIDTLQEAVTEEPQQTTEAYAEEPQRATDAYMEESLQDTEAYMENRQTVTAVPVEEQHYGYGAEEHWELEPSIYRDDEEEPEEDPSYDRSNVN